MKRNLINYATCALFGIAFCLFASCRDHKNSNDGNTTSADYERYYNEDPLNEGNQSGVDSDADVNRNPERMDDTTRVENSNTTNIPNQTP